MVAGRESVQFDIFANDLASAAFLKVGQTANNAADNVAQLSRKMDAVNSKVANARVAVTGDAAANLALDRLLLKEAAVAKRITPEITVEGAARAGVALDSVAVAADSVTAKAAAAGTATARGGFLAAAAAKQFNLFGGALKGVPILGAVTGLHLLADAAIEVTAVVVPAGIALGAFGIAAVPAIQNVVHQLQAMRTVMQATGKTIPPLTGGFQKVAAAVQPQVYQLFGQALNIAAHSTGTFSQLATGAGGVLDRLAARFEVAVTSGHGFSVFTANAVTDLGKLGDIVGNLGGVLGNVFKAVPGYAQALLSVVDAGSRVLEWASSVSVPVLRMGLAFHGAFLYTGLLATGVTLLAQKGLPLLAKGALSAGLAVERFGPAGAKAATALGGFAASAEKAGGLPWGWIGAAAAGFGLLAYWVLTTKDRTQAWIDSLQQALNTTPAVKGFTLAALDSVKVSSNLAYQNRQVTAALKDMQPAVQGVASRYETNYNPALDSAATAAVEAQRALTGFAAQQQQAGRTVTSLGQAYGSQRTALGLLTAAGITWGQIASKNKDVQAQLRAQIAATAKAYQLMGQTGGILGADMQVITHLASDQYVQMGKLNSAWTQYIGDFTGLLTGAQAIEQAMKTVAKDARSQSASYTGASAASLKLQADTGQLVNGIQTEINSMRTAGDSTGQLATVLRHALLPAVNDGALRNDALRAAIAAMAHEAGYNGVNSVAALKAWFDKGTHSANAFARAARSIPGTIRERVTATGQWSVSGLGPALNAGTSGQGRYASGTAGAAPGWAWVGEKGPELVKMRGGETVIPNHKIPANLPGYASGTPSYSGSLPGVWKWALGDLKATETGMFSSLAQAVTQGIRQAATATAGGAVSGGAVEALARRMFPWPSYMWTDYTLVESREAGWNIHARNPSSGAYGLAQFINGPSEYYQWGGNPFTAAGQLTGMFNYIASRYGNPLRAWGHELSYGWYGNGTASAKPGWAVVGERGPELVRFRGGEQVIPSRAGSAGGGTVRVQLEWAGGHAGDELLTWIRRQIRIRGGNVQQVLGRT